MENDLIKLTSNSLSIDESKVKKVMELIKDGNTIPFIARYRKEATGGLNEDEIRKIETFYEYEKNLNERKEEVIRLIDEKGLLNDELLKKINECKRLVEIEDIYRPFKEKKKTKATIAINNGLEPLAKIILSSSFTGDVLSVCKKYLNDSVKNADEALEGAKYIIAEWISDNAYYRKYIRNYIYKNGYIESKLKKDSNDEKKIYEMYYEYSEKISSIKMYRVLAINRGEKEKILNVSIKIDNDKIYEFLESKVIKNESSSAINVIKDAIKDSYKRLIFPSIEREIRKELKDRADEVAISNFSENLEKLLLTKPLKEKNVLGFDPAYRTGCKLAVLDKNGNLIKTDVIYPHEPHNKILEAKKIITKIVNDYNIEIIAIGNGTASRESEKFISECIKENNLSCEFAIVNEAGASVYSASILAKSEFPDLDVSERSAISIGRRIIDPLNELVKIEPCSIGVGLYQHDVSKTNLSDTLNFTVLKIVNQVGVNVNTANSSILKYISGLNKTSITRLLKYRDEKKKIESREELIKNKVLTKNEFTQSSGFLRIYDSNNILDSTSIHPESYDKVFKLLDYLNLDVNDIGKDKLIDKLNVIDKSEIIKNIEIDEYTLDDIIESLKKPLRDIRDNYLAPKLKSDIVKITDLKVGDKLEGVVRNVVDFGAFVDIGIKNDGLVHISKITSEYIKHPSEKLSVGDIVGVYVIDVDLEKEKVSLSMIE